MKLRLPKALVAVVTSSLLTIGLNAFAVDYTANCSGTSTPITCVVKDTTTPSYAITAPGTKDTITFDVSAGYLPDATGGKTQTISAAIVINQLKLDNGYSGKGTTAWYKFTGTVSGTGNITRTNAQESNGFEFSNDMSEYSGNISISGSSTSVGYENILKLGAISIGKIEDGTVVAGSITTDDRALFETAGSTVWAEVKATKMLIDEGNTTLNGATNIITNLTNNGTLTLGATAALTTGTISGGSLVLNNGSIVNLDSMSEAYVAQTGKDITGVGTCKAGYYLTTGTVTDNGAIFKLDGEEAAGSVSGNIFVEDTSAELKYYNIVKGGTATLATVTGNADVVMAQVNGTLSAGDATASNLTLQGSGTYQLGAGSSLHGATLGAEWDGTLEIQGSTSTITVSNDFVNSSDLSIVSGTVEFAHNGTNVSMSKDLNIGSGATFSDSATWKQSLTMNGALTGSGTLYSAVPTQNNQGDGYRYVTLNGNTEKFTGTWAIETAGSSNTSGNRRIAAVLNSADSKFGGVIKFTSSTSSAPDSSKTSAQLTVKKSMTIGGLEGTLGTVVTDSSSAIDLTIYSTAARTFSGNIGTNINLKNTGTGSLTLDGSSLGSTYIKGITLNGVTLSSTGSRITLSGDVTFNSTTTFADGCGDSNYKFLNDDTTNMIVNGTVDLGESLNYIGFGSKGTITVKNGGSLTAGLIMNTTRIDGVDINASTAASSDNAAIKVESGGQLTAGVSGNKTIARSFENAGTSTISGIVLFGSLTNSGTLNLSAANLQVNTITLGGGTVTLGSAETEAGHNYNLTTTTLTVTADSTVNANLVLADGANVKVSKVTVTEEGAEVTRYAQINLGCTLTLSGAASFTLSDQVTSDASTFGTVMVGVDGLTNDWDSLIVNGSDDTYYYHYVTESSSDGTYTYSLSDTADSMNHMVVYNATKGTLMVTPEPATATLSLLALAGLAARRRRLR